MSGLSPTRQERAGGGSRCVSASHRQTSTRPTGGHRLTHRGGLCAVPVSNASADDEQQEQSENDADRFCQAGRCEVGDDGRGVDGARGESVGTGDAMRYIRLLEAAGAVGKHRKFKVKPD